MDICGDDIRVARFFLAYLEMHENATKAYKHLNPHVTDKAAGVLGSRMLARVRKSALFDSVNMGLQRYLATIDEGLEATAVELVEVGEGETTKLSRPDWETRTVYHGKLGNLLGLERKEGSGVAIQVNQNNVANLSDDDLDGYLDR